MRTDGTGDASSPTEAVLYKIAGQKGVSPEELNPPLHDVIDTDALDAIFLADTGHISFDYHGYAVIVDHSGNVNLEPTGGD